MHTPTRFKLTNLSHASCVFWTSGCDFEFAGTVFAIPVDTVQWCVKSAQEYDKCQAIARSIPNFACVEKANTAECITAIKVRKANEQLCKVFAQLHNSFTAPCLICQYVYVPFSHLLDDFDLSDVDIGVTIRQTATSFWIESLSLLFNQKIIVSNNTRAHARTHSKLVSIKITYSIIEKFLCEKNPLFMFFI